MDSSCNQHPASLCVDGLEAFPKAPGCPKASDLLSSKTASYHRYTKGHRNSLQPLSAKGINVQTKPLAVSKINPYALSPGAQSATYALHRNACSRGSWAAVGSWEPKQSSAFDHRNATLINYFDSLRLKALEISTGRSRGGFSPASILYCPLQLIPTYNRCHFKKKEKKIKKVSWRTYTKITREPSVPQNFQQRRSSQKKRESTAIKANIPR